MEAELSQELKIYYDRVAYSTINETIKKKVVQMAEEIAADMVGKMKLETVFRQKVDAEDFMVIKFKLTV